MLYKNTSMLIYSNLSDKDLSDSKSSLLNSYLSKELI